MKIEHVGFQVEDVAAVADWYVEHLGFTVKRGADQPVPVRFLADGSGAVMLEIYNNPQVKTPEYAEIDPLILHYAFVSDDVAGDVERLVAAGATTVSLDNTPSGDEIAILRDPWGLPIQMCKRADPMV